jgi:hypothetical protein
MITQQKFEKLVEIHGVSFMVAVINLLFSVKMQVVKARKAQKNYFVLRHRQADQREVNEALIKSKNEEKKLDDLVKEVDGLILEVV